jgi:hypothetical protein
VHHVAEREGDRVDEGPHVDRPVGHVADLQAGDVGDHLGAHVGPHGGHGDAGHDDGWRRQGAPGRLGRGRVHGVLRFWSERIAPGGWSGTAGPQMMAGPPTAVQDLPPWRPSR